MPPSRLGDAQFCAMGFRKMRMNCGHVLWFKNSGLPLAIDAAAAKKGDPHGSPFSCGERRCGRLFARATGPALRLRCRFGFSRAGLNPGKHFLFFPYACVCADQPAGRKAVMFDPMAQGWAGADNPELFEITKSNKFLQHEEHLQGVIQVYERALGLVPLSRDTSVS
jgi:hypothetical protein